MNALRQWMERRRQIRRLAEAIVAALAPDPSDARAQRAAAAKALRGYSADARDMLSDWATIDGWNRWANSLLRNVVMQRPEYRLWEILYFLMPRERPQGDWRSPANNWSADLPALLVGLKSDPVAGPRIMSMSRRPSSELVDGINAVLAVSYEILEATPGRLDEMFVLTEPTPRHGFVRTTSPIRLANPELTALILERPHDAGRIARIVLDNGSDDADRVRSVLDSPTPALAEGSSEPVAYIDRLILWPAERLILWRVTRGVHRASWKAMPRREIAATLKRYSAAARRMVAKGLRSPGAYQSVVAEAVCRDLPEGYLWAWSCRGERPAGEWVHSENEWKWDVTAFMGTLHDPVLAPNIVRMTAPDPERATRIWAVLAVLAEAVAVEARRTPVRRQCSPFVVEEHHPDRTEGRALPSYWEPSHPLRRLRNPRLSELVFERPQDAHRIASLMRERSTDDADFIASILDAEASSLSGGML